MTERRVLVTGADGLLGRGVRAVVHEYPHLEFRCVSWHNPPHYDLTDRRDVATMIHAIRPDAILHLAAVSGGVSLSQHRPASLLRNNVLMDLNMLDHTGGDCKLVLSLSIGMYPSSAAVPYVEGSIHNGLPSCVAYSYAHAKRLLEPAIRAYRAQTTFRLP